MSGSDRDRLHFKDYETVAAWWWRHRTSASCLLAMRVQEILTDFPEILAVGQGLSALSSAGGRRAQPREHYPRDVASERARACSAPRMRSFAGLAGTQGFLEPAYTYALSRFALDANVRRRL